ncbi:MAG: family 43 glycosylhydrolase, partial [Armatimonadetes bacterium]|nr:family 43 glycosylhydrolase [Armatimonadota bacterium]
MVTKIRTLAMVVFVVVAASLMVMPVNAGTSWNSLKAGNPVLPGYFADPCCRKFGDTYYLYVTPDGWDVGKGPYAIWTSKDFVNWTAHKSLGVKPNTVWPATDLKWAPSVVEYKGKYYMYTQTPCMVWGAVGDTPLGPWKSLSEEGKPMIPDATPKGTIVLDGECFIDTDGQIYIWYGCWWTPTLARMKTDMCTIAGDPIQYFKKGDNQTPKGTIQGCMEAPYVFKRNGTYYLMYSDFFCNNSTYCVEYSTSTSPDGPFTYGKNNPILSTNADDTVDGPGHHTMLEDGGKVYIIYHRHDNPHAADGAHRQTAIDELHFNADGSIEKVVPTHSAVGYLAPSTKRDTNLALGKTATASSFAGPDFKPAYAADENNGTLWSASEYKFPQWFQIDLGKSEKVARVETEFQFAQVGYSYIIESSDDGKTWKTFADRRENKDWGPMIDKGSVTARYFKISILGDDTPSRPSPEIAIWNMKIYDGIDKPNQAPKVDAGPDVKGAINFATRIVDGVVNDDGLPNGPVSVKWTKVSGPGSVVFEHPDRVYSNVTFGGAGKYVLQLEANDGKLKGVDTVTFDILPPGDQLIWYKFDEEGGTVAADSSINGQFGVANVGIARCLGMYGGALNMSGNDSVTVPSLGEQTSLTIAAWVNPHTLNADQNSIICSNGENGVLQATIARSGEIHLAISGKQVASSDFKFTKDTLGWWKHIAISYDGSAKSVSFFVDGKLDSTRTLAEAAKLDLSSGLKIGGAAAGVRGLDGEMDDFRLYAKALTANEIAEMSTPAKFPSISDVKKLKAGTAVTLMGKVVTYAPMDPMTFERTSQIFYISERDGSAGILVNDGNAGQDKVKPDTCISLTGAVMRGDEGQVGISLTSAPSLGAPYTAKISDIREANALIKI